MSYSKMGYYRVITSLVGIILLLIMFMIIRPTKIETVEITKEVEVPKEVIVEVEKEIVVEKEVIVEVEKEPTYAYNITSSEREMLARLLYREANTESLECQMAVVSVVINRWQNGKWGNSVKEVINSPGQFSTSHLIPRTTPTELNYTAVDLVLKNGSTLPAYCMYFRSKHHFDWKGYEPYAQINNTYFGYFKSDR